METNVWGMPYELVTERGKAYVGLSTLCSSKGTMTRDWSETMKVLMDTLLSSDSPQGETVLQESLRIGMDEEYGMNHTSPLFSTE